MENKEWMSTVYGLFFSERVTLNSLFQRRRDLENQNIQQNVWQIFLMLKQTPKLGWINSVHLSSLLRSSTVSEVLLDVMLLFQGNKVDLTGAFYNEQHASEISICISGQDWSQLPYFKSARNLSICMDLFWLQCK